MNNTKEFGIDQSKTTLRNRIFWLLDQLKGSKARDHYDTIKRINRNHLSEFALQKRKEYLSAILAYALHNVPYYSSLGLEAAVLLHFPVVNKNLIREQYEAFGSNGHRDRKNFKVTTSGSTGTPFTVIQNPDKRRRHMADVRFFWDTVFHPWGTKLYYLKLWNKRNSKGVLTQKVQNIVPVDVLKLTDQKIEELLKNIIKDNTPKSIVAYASALDQIVKYLKRHPTYLSNTGVLSIIAMSESLDTMTKEYLENRFKCPVVSRYANLENGMLAQQTAVSGNDFLVNLASYHIEILAVHSDTPVRNGETGRIVVTDLFNRAMPLIRYDTGDLGVFQKIEENGAVQYVLKKVEGRKMDAIYDTKGVLVSSLLLSNSMWKYDELDQFQFIQLGRNTYTFRLNAAIHFSRETELINEFKECLGNDASITVEYVNEIPLLSSGKRKKVLNKMFEEGNNVKNRSNAF